ncbi:type II secretion system protein GspL [Caldimonas tepidiphila]|uniref:type II secretion system protein GspL n=1 Tax=Caldimonas tepidiphila TaxID=2315841 RepID=UPI000E5A8FED|nr:type II secretion system protein GspL [Caldimonas tepidiphila]
MSTLIIRLAPRPRLAAREADAVLRVPAEWSHVFSAGSQLSEGRAAAALLPRADSVVAVVPAGDLSWHRIEIPKAPAGRLRAALAGVLEDALLEDPADAHFALGPDARPGQAGWVAVVHRPWLTMQLQALESAGVVVDRVVPQLEPRATPWGHFERDAPDDEDAALRLLWADERGAVTMPVGTAGGTLARALLPSPLPADTTWTAEPTAAAAAEQWLGHSVSVLSRADLALRAAGSAWNLRQFELTLRHRGVRALRDQWRAFLTPAWAPVRWGLATLLVVQVIGLNAWAWEQRQAVAERQRAMVAMLQQAHPQVRAVLDAPVQMRRETELLRVRAGRPGDGDLETLLQAAATAWPRGRQIQGLRFEPGVLTLDASNWNEDEMNRFASTLQPGGWQVQREGSRLVLRRAAAGASS